MIQASAFAFEPRNRKGVPPQAGKQGPFSELRNKVRICLPSHRLSNISKISSGKSRGYIPKFGSNASKYPETARSGKTEVVE
ncbi:hypothetical protein A2773_02730 [Candidatus Gottesmanbacteria bacterium RIFCSPHIGHO2_01_FULL_39_10]|uniref:Uncharacterized protein n=1 Tax=Candidatus Gottesmanbacteria bacterium RIFCSPHIGHO2_01_FULL_39_10 TaxID=1798375 RepID=A0A1F5ZN35_9BACT|nr:MAG: hypothetical protein A2773_02730 [Candidatus Gottesmanbacteria bacterium RIFCSPHIGHO2_01_FULL_39_10]